MTIDKQMKSFPGNDERMSVLHQDSGGIVSVLHQDEGGIGKSIPDARKISRDPRDFPRAKPEGNLEGRGKSGGQRGWISQYLPSFGGARTISQHPFFYREWIRKSFPLDREGLAVLKSIFHCWMLQIASPYQVTWENSRGKPSQTNCKLQVQCDGFARGPHLSWYIF